MRLSVNIKPIDHKLNLKLRALTNFFKFFQREKFEIWAIIKVRLNNHYRILYIQVNMFPLNKSHHNKSHH